MRFEYSRAYIRLTDSPQMTNSVWMCHHQYNQTLERNAIPVELMEWNERNVYIPIGKWLVVYTILCAIEHSIEIFISNRKISIILSMTRYTCDQKNFFLRRTLDFCPSYISVYKRRFKKFNQNTSSIPMWQISCVQKD